ncbi:hypothetical protein L3X38_003673 [Prunus dulcis]|uniref:Integrase zinc-binding domain-containing protein n=1 Tax=Prunus dulcis TaxID=3755 RepID=A0AAD4ZMG4_PRUDU|nr:hypothetical protein L3X38_003673 [Prunus dulcis]
MYHTLREHYWWPFMKKEIAEFVRRCLICQKVKAERQKPSGLLQPLPIPEWKWEQITMNFVFKLPQTQSKHDGVYQVSIGMSPFDALYGKQCRTPFYWDEVGEHRLEVSEDVELTKKQVKIIRERLKTAQD